MQELKPNSFFGVNRNELGYCPRRGRYPAIFKTPTSP